MCSSYPSPASVGHDRSGSANVGDDLSTRRRGPPIATLLRPGPAVLWLGLVAFGSARSIGGALSYHCTIQQRLVLVGVGGMILNVICVLLLIRIVQGIKIRLRGRSADSALANAWRQR